MGGKKKCFINLYFKALYKTCNLNTFVLENDFEYSPFLLTQLEHDSTIFLPLLLAYTFDVLDHIHQHNQSNTIRYLLCTIYYALYIMHYEFLLCSMHYALCTMHYLLCTIHYALCTIYYALYTMYYAYIFIRIHTYLLFYTYSYVFTISHGNPAKSRDFGTYA